MRILIAEDEASLREILTTRLSQEGYNVDSVADGEEALEYIYSAEYDCVILDIMMPKLDGIGVLQAMRTKANKTPVMLLTAKDSIHDRVQGLDVGADDYLVKPFAYDELLARLRALLRRNSENKTNILTFADLQIDLLKREVIRAGITIDLSSKEFMLLEYLMRNPNTVLSRHRIIDHVWNFDYDSGTNLINVYIRYLRAKIDDDFDVKLIHTVRGMGYILKEGDNA